MPHPSKSARKARSRKSLSAHTRIAELERVIAKQHEALGVVVERLMNESDQKAHLSKLLATHVALSGGAIKVKLSTFEQFPTTAKLQEMVDVENDEIILMTVLEEDTDAPAEPKIELVQPEIVAPSDAQIEIVTR